jgi:hypothetical protein
MLAILFNVAFANLHNYDTFKAFDVAVVDDESYKNSQFLSEGIKAVSEGDDKVFETRYVNKDEAEQLLDDEKIEGYIYVENNEPHVKIKKNGVKIVYCGSLMQQNMGENLSGHGGVIWDVENKEWVGFDLDRGEYGHFKFVVDGIEDLENDNEKILNL